MKKIVSLISWCITLILTSNTSYASHAVGMDMTYTWVGPNQYKIRVSFYRDCAGTNTACPLPNQDTISVMVTAKNCAISTCTTTPSFPATQFPWPANNITPPYQSTDPNAPGYCTLASTGCNGGGFCYNCTAVPSYTVCNGIKVILNKLPGSGQEVSPICPSSKSTCSGGTEPGIREYVYEGIVTLPGQCNNWVVSYFVIARNATDALQSNGNQRQSMYVEAVIDNTVGQNSSPFFTNKPVPFICAGQQFCFNNGAYDIDGDSLTYTLATPQQIPYSNGGKLCGGWQITGVPGDVIYNPGYSSKNPITSSSPFTFDTTTGSWCVTPSKQEVAVLTVKVNEYRNKVLIGTVVRDIQVNIVNCNNKIPDVTGINGTNKFDTTVCANKAFCFTVTSSDPDTTQKDTLIWNNGIPGATFTVSAGKNPTGTFCWTPKASDVGQPKCFTIQVKDDNCPMYGSQTKSYCIKVLGPKVYLGNDTSVCLGPVVLTNKYHDPAYIYEWSTGETTSSISVNSTGTYWLKASGGIAGCVNSDTITVKTGVLDIYLGTDQTRCAGDSIILNAGSGSGYVYSWQPGGETTQSITVKTSGQYKVTVTNGSCTGMDSVTINFIIPPVITAAKDTTICLGETVTLTATSTVNPTNYVWLPAGPLDNAVSATPKATPSSTTTFTLTGTINGGCKDTATVTVTIAPSPTLSVSDISICKGSTGQLSASGANTYSWSPSNGLSSTSTAVVNVNVLSSNTYTLMGTVGVCTATTQVYVDVVPYPTLTISPSITICAGSSTILSSGGALMYQWSPFTGLNNPFSSTTNASPATTTTYVVTGSNSSICPATASVVVTVNPTPTLAVIPGNQLSICQGDSLILTASGAITYNWLPASGLSATSGNIVTVKPVNLTNNYILTGNNNLCTNTLAITVTKLALPTLVTQNATICMGSAAVLTVGGASTYTWLPDPTLDTVNQITDTVIVKPNSDSKYYVIGTGSNGCKQKDTVSVQVTPQGIPIVSYPGEQPVILCDSSKQLQLIVKNAGSIIWSPPDDLSCFGCVNPVVQPSKHIYTVTVTSVCGNLTASTTIEVKRCLKIPNVLTSKEENSAFLIQNIEDYPNSKLVIYDRWGLKIHENSNYNNLAAWNGSGHSDGTYYYILYVSDGEVYKGFITLIKNK